MILPGDCNARKRADPRVLLPLADSPAIPRDSFSSIELSQNHVNKGSHNDRQVISTNDQDASLRLISIRSDGYPLDGAIYSISPNPFDNSRNYVAKVNSLGAGDSTAGIITMFGL